MRRPDTIDEYLAAVPDDTRAALEKLRRAIKAAAPRAEECISYGIPAFRLDARVLVCFAAASNHCSFFPGAATRGLPVRHSQAPGARRGLHAWLPVLLRPQGAPPRALLVRC